MNMNSLKLRPVTVDDAQLLKSWDEKPHIIKSNPNDKWDWNEELRNPPPGMKQWIAGAGGRPIGFLQIMDPALDESRYWGNTGEGYRAIDIWIGEESELGKGYGTKMMKLAVERCFSVQDVHTILIDPLASNTKAHRFYERLGFQFVEKRRFGQDECFVFKLERSTWAELSSPEEM
jgi:aminoglycoside 6'-N-acetyltransferase